MSEVIKTSAPWILVTVAVFGLVLAGQFHRVSDSADLAALQDAGYFKLETPVALDDIALVDHHGKPARLQSISGDWTIVFFGFTYCPDVCPTTMSILNLALSKMQEVPTVIMVSVDPARDNPSHLKDYVTGFNPSFIGLTGTGENIRRLADQLAIAYAKVPSESEDQYLIEHSGVLVVLDPSGQHAGYIRPPHHPEKLRRIFSALLDG
ncbi:MAG: SCO family protein [Pseudomonadales bacterium]